MEITVTKRIAKQGQNLIVIIPKDLHSFLQHGDLVKININKLEAKK